MIAIALMLAASPQYIDPWEDTPSEPPPPVESFSRFSRVGFTGNVGVFLPLPVNDTVGVHGGLGVRYGLRPEAPGSSTYFTPAISFLLTGDYATSEPGRPANAQPLSGSQLATVAPGPISLVGADVRLELTVSRHAGMLMPEFASWIVTGGSAMFTGDGVRPAAHFGIGLSIDFVRDVVPGLAQGLFDRDWRSGGGGWGGAGGGFNLGGLGSGGGYAIIALAIIIIAIPVIIAAGIAALFVGATVTSMANVELRYTVFPSDRGGAAGYGGLVLGFGL